jgi:2-amino-4-hydroxy-6-hydroxymethyldihydropteridine diphosphokinase
MTHIYLALGANVGDKKEHIGKAIDLLSESVTDISRAPLYETKAVGFTQQDNFLNTVIGGNTGLSPQSLLTFVKAIEKKIGRIYRFRWGPREIDIDILFYWDLIIKKNNLEIPHPRLQQRDFVLKPLCELDENIMHPAERKTVGELYRLLPKSELSVLQKMK